MCPGLFYEKTTMVAYGTIDGFYIAFNYSWKGAHFFQYIHSSSFNPLGNLRVGVISGSVVLGAPAGKNPKLSLISFLSEL